MIKRLSITARGDLAFQDYRGLQGILSGAVKAGETRSYDLTTEQWNGIRPTFTKLSQKRIELIESSLRTGRYQPLLTYVVDQVPGGRPRVHQIEGTISAAGATQTLTLRGESLIQGFQSQVIVKKNTAAQITFQATRKGPIGDKVAVKINKVPATTNAGSVTVTRRPHGGALIEVTPPDVGTSASGGQAGAIVSQINAVAEAARFVTAIGAGTGLVGPIDTVSLTGGDGEGIAHLDLFTLVAGSYLRIEAQVPGNGGNGISIKFLTPSGGGTVVADATAKTLIVTPAAAAMTLTAVAAQINGSAIGKTMVKATVIGTGSTAFATAAIGWQYLYGGSGDDVVVKVGGMPVRVTAYSDTAITVAFEGAGGAPDMLAAAGIAATEQALVTVLSDYGVIQAGQVLVAT